MLAHIGSTKEPLNTVLGLRHMRTWQSIDLHTLLTGRDGAIGFRTS